MKILVNINKVEVPIEVFHSMAARTIYDQYNDWKIPIPKEIQIFLNKHDLDAGYDWQIELMEQSNNMPLELLEKWVEIMPTGLCRAEMRATLKSRNQES